MSCVAAIASCALGAIGATRNTAIPRFRYRITLDRPPVYIVFITLSYL